MPKLTVKCSVEELELWKVAAHGRLVTLSAWVRDALASAALEGRGGAAQDAQVSRATAGTAGTPSGDGADLGSRSLHAPRPSSADAVREAEDWLKARADRPARPDPKGGRR